MIEKNNPHIALPIDLDTGPKFGLMMTSGHYTVMLGHSEGRGLFKTDRKHQAHLVHMALANAQDDSGLIDTLSTITHSFKCDEVYGKYSPVQHVLVWMPESEFDKIVEALTRAGEHGMAAAMRQGTLKKGGRL